MSLCTLKSVSMRVFLLIAAIFVAAINAHEEEALPSMKGMQSLTITFDTLEKLMLIKSYETVPGFIFLMTGRNTVDVLVIADEVEFFKQVLDNNDIEYTVTVEDVEKLVMEEHANQMSARGREMALVNRRNSGKLSFTYYPDANEVNNYLEYIARTYGDVATVIDAGSSYEGRKVKGLKISSDGRDKPTVFIDGGIHAREWIAPVTALYIIDQLVANKSNRKLIENVNWVIVPLVNPDGYQFTHSNPQNRLWRKTRSVQKSSNCRGVDGNRNYDMAWMLVGASSNPCSDTYAGRAPFSEPETKIIRDLMLSQKGKVKAYISLHSYGQYILYPWGYTNKKPKNVKQLGELADICVNAIAAIRETQYTHGTSANHLYLSSGGSDDWALDKGGAELSYTYELPGGLGGFVLPASEIKPVGTETFEAIKATHAYITK